MSISQPETPEDIQFTITEDNEKQEYHIYKLLHTCGSTGALETTKSRQNQNLKFLHTVLFICSMNNVSVISVVYFINNLLIDCLHTIMVILNCLISPFVFLFQNKSRCISSIVSLTCPLIITALKHVVLRFTVTRPGQSCVFSI